MMCIHCQSKTKVIDSRTPGTGKINPSVIAALNRGQKAFGWWSNEFTVRRRECQTCKERFWSIEISIMDLKDALTEARERKDLGTPWQQSDITEEQEETTTRNTQQTINASFGCFIFY